MAAARSRPPAPSAGWDVSVARNARMTRQAAEKVHTGPQSGWQAVRDACMAIAATGAAHVRYMTWRAAQFTPAPSSFDVLPLRTMFFSFPGLSGLLAGFGFGPLAAGGAAALEDGAL
eukprot:356379-Chlamydomonas_euryale.AAC.2